MDQMFSVSKLLAVGNFYTMARIRMQMCTLS